MLRTASHLEERQMNDYISEQVYKTYFNKVFGYVIKRVTCRADAEDITSDIFLKLLSRPEGFDPERKGASTYVFRVMQTTLTDYYREKKIAFEPLDEIAEVADREDDYDELLDELNNALDKLSEREQSIVILHYYHGLSHKDIADKMNMSYTNTRQLCHTALKKLRKNIK